MRFLDAVLSEFCVINCQVCPTGDVSGSPDTGRIGDMQLERVQIVQFRHVISCINWFRIRRGYTSAAGVLDTDARKLQKVYDTLDIDTSRNRLQKTE